MWVVSYTFHPFLETKFEKTLCKFDMAEKGSGGGISFIDIWLPTFFSLFLPTSTSFLDVQK